MLVFSALAVSLGLLMATYWLWSLEPRLTADAASRAAALAQAQSGALAQVLSGDTSGPMPKELERAMDGILLVRDPYSEAPMVRRIELSVDYQALGAVEGTLDLARGHAACGSCIINEVPLYHQRSLALIGIARFYSGRDFLDGLTAEVRNKLVWGGVAMLLLIALAWAGTNRLLRRLHRSEANLRGVFEAIPFPMVLRERGQQGLVRANRAALEYLALEADDSGHYSSLDWERLRETMPEQQQGQPGELELGNADKRRWVLASSRVVSYDGSPSTLISLADISPLKQAQKALMRAKDEAESATRAKSAFVATISHEIRTPLNAILGMAHLLAGESLSPGQRLQVAAIKEAGDALLGQVTGILDFSQIEAGRLELTTEQFDLQRMVAGTLSIFAVKARQKGIRLESRLPPGLNHYYIGDAQRIQQILINLMGNAVKFTETGWIRLVVNLSRRDGQSDDLEFHVADSGVGIQPDQLVQLFEEFTQGDSSVSRRHGGTGLGLAICQRLATLMDGELQVSSIPGEGSTFSLLLPLRRGRAIDRNEQGAAALASRKVVSMRILVVDDEGLNRVFMRELLERSGHRVEVAENGKLALESMQRQPFDLVLMDIRMPVMDGLEAARRIRSHPDRDLADTPLVALTADVTQDTIKACAQAGLDEVLSKPLTPVLLEKILRALGDDTPEGACGQATTSQESKPME